MKDTESKIVVTKYKGMDIFLMNNYFEHMSERY